MDIPKILYPNTVNVNPSILSFYTRQIVPRITKTATVQLATSKRARGIIGDDEYEDDGNYGSAATLDIEVLQAISKRVHYGEPAQRVPQNHVFRKTDYHATLPPLSFTFLPSINPEPCDFHSSLGTFTN